MADTLSLPIPGGAAPLALREPLLKHLLAAEAVLLKEPGNPRGRDVALIALVAGVSEEGLRDLPVSIQARAIAFLDGFDSIAPPVEDRDEDALVIELDPPLRLPNGEEYAAIRLSEPRVADVEAAERALARGTNPHSMRVYQQTLLSRAGDLPPALVPLLPVRVVNRGHLFLSRFIKAGSATGAG